MYNLKEELKKVSLIESLVDDGYEDDFAESIVESLFAPSSPAYVCKTPEELTAAIAEMSEGDDD